MVNMGARPLRRIIVANRPQPFEIESPPSTVYAPPDVVAGVAGAGPRLSVALNLFSEEGSKSRWLRIAKNQVLNICKRVASRSPTV
jgi:hypothetical protein